MCWLFHRRARIRRTGGVPRIFPGLIRADCLSPPVVIGFTNAAASIIAASQLNKLFGASVQLLLVSPWDWHRKPHETRQTLQRLSSGGERAQRGCSGVTASNTSVRTRLTKFIVYSGTQAHREDSGPMCQPAQLAPRPVSYVGTPGPRHHARGGGRVARI